MAEMYIPTDRVPPEILSKLREIGLLLQSETTMPRIASSSSSSSLSSNKRDVDECDDLLASGKDSNPIVHVLGGGARSEESGQKDGSVVSLLGRGPPLAEDNTSLRSRLGATEALTQAEKESDVVSVLSSRSSFSQLTGHNSVQSQPQSEPFPSPSKQAVHPQNNQQCSTPSRHNHLDGTDPYGVHVPPGASSHRLSPVLATEKEGERRVVNNRSPGKTVSKHEDAGHQPHDTPHALSHSQSLPESAMAAVLSSPPSQSSHSRSPPSHHAGSNQDDDIVRVFPSCSSQPSADIEERSPKVLTPPETPENEVKRVIPDVFTFDDLTCTQERFQQTLEVTAFNSAQRCSSIENFFFYITSTVTLLDRCCLNVVIIND